MHIMVTGGEEEDDINEDDLPAADHYCLIWFDVPLQKFFVFDTLGMKELGQGMIEGVLWFAHFLKLLSKSSVEINTSLKNITRDIHIINHGKSPLRG